MEFWVWSSQFWDFKISEYIVLYLLASPFINSSLQLVILESAMVLRIFWPKPELFILKNSNIRPSSATQSSVIILSKLSQINKEMIISF